jgi:hypothetical protein
MFNYDGKSNTRLVGSSNVYTKRNSIWRSKNSNILKNDLIYTRSGIIRGHFKSSGKQHHPDNTYIKILELHQEILILLCQLKCTNHSD